MIRCRGIKDTVTILKEAVYSGASQAQVTIKTESINTLLTLLSDSRSQPGIWVKIFERHHRVGEMSIEQVPAHVAYWQGDDERLDQH